MKILHVCLAAFYIDNYSYQENMLPKYHKKLGHDVSILASLQTFDKNGNPSFLEEESEYINEHGIPVKRIKYKKFINPLVKKLKIYNDIYNILKKERPDIIFIHGCQFFNMRDIKKYVIENPNTKIFVDNHCDFSNSATNWFSKNILHKIIWRYMAKIIEPYTEKFYGVMPARVDFLIDIYKIPKEKTELLVMGGDDEKIAEAKNPEIINQLRDKLNINENDFVIVTGGKIDEAKAQTLLLMEAVKKINRKDVKLIVFGSVEEKLKDKFMRLCDDNIVKYVGWISSDDSYKYFELANFVVFPGRHSVFWEQVVAQGKPIICKYWSGSTHVDVGGNCKFLNKDSINEIRQTIMELVNNKKEYNKMKNIALKMGMGIFSYKIIAEKSINSYVEKSGR